MYLKSLQISGFKSFAQKTTLDFKNNISAIVGPNGSGKSNVTEAFRFALGEQSMKNMRGKKGEDLIFSGRTGRLNRAGVKVIFNNKDRVLDIDYEVVEMERVVFRDGVNDYLINKNKVRVKDFSVLLGSANIGSSSHHIISQGEADKILSVSTKERKIILEDALGLKPFIMKRNDAEKKLASTAENLKEVKIKVKINAPRIKFLFREVEKADKIKTQKEELEKLYQIFFPKKVKEKQKLREVDEKLNKIFVEKNNLEQKIFNKKKDLKQIQEQGSTAIKKDERIEKLEIESKDLISQKSVLQRNLAKVEYEFSQLERERQSWEENSKSTQKKLEIFNGKLKEVLHIINTFFQKNSNIKNAETKSLGIDILKYFGINKDGQQEKKFSEEEIERLKKVSLDTKVSLENILAKESVISQKMRILSQTGEINTEIFGQEIVIEILQLEKVLGGVVSKINSYHQEKIIILKKLEVYRKEETYAISFFGLEKLRFFKEEKQNLKQTEELELNLMEKIQRIRILLENNGGDVSEELIKEYDFLVKNQAFVKKEIEDLEKSKLDLEKIIIEITAELEKRFRGGLESINREFSKFFNTLFSGGLAEIYLIKIPCKVKDDDLKNEQKMKEFELGLEINLSLPHKKITGLAMLSGGERSLVSIALLFAMSAINPPPFIILDETDAALDEANSKRYGDMIEILAEHSQLILITHNRETMSRAGILYGVTMGADGVSRLLSVSLEEAEQVAK